MTELKLPRLADRAPVRIALSLSPELHKALSDYAGLYEQAYGAAEPIHELIPAILTAFLQSDRAFARRRKEP